MAVKDRLLTTKLVFMFSLNHIREAWAQFAREFGAEHNIVGAEAYTELLDTVTYRHKGWQITMEYVIERQHSSVGRINRAYIYVPVKFEQSYHLVVFRDGFLWKLDKFFGMLEDVTTGDAEIDKLFIVQTDDEARTKDFLLEPKVRTNLLLLQSHINSAQFIVGENKALAESPRYDGGDFKPLAESLKLNAHTFVCINLMNNESNVENLKAMFQLVITTIDYLSDKNIIQPAIQ